MKGKPDRGRPQLGVAPSGHPRLGPAVLSGCVAGPRLLQLCLGLGHLLLLCLNLQKKKKRGPLRLPLPHLGQPQGPASTASWPNSLKGPG